MSGICKAIILGRLGKDPEVGNTANGNSFCKFSVATSDQWKDKSGQKQEKTEWSNIVAWGQLAETCAKYLSKGRQVYIEGKIQTRSWDDKDGKKCYMTEINAQTVQFIGEKGETKADESGSMLDKEQKPGTNPNFAGSEIPF